MTVIHTGICFCGAVEIETSGEPEAMGYCHCASCRLYSGAPFVTFVLFESENVRTTKGAELLAGFDKAGISDRQFCTKCGGHLMSHHPQWGYTDVYAATLPALEFKPQYHVNYAEAVMPVRDGLPKFRGLPAGSRRFGRNPARMIRTSAARRARAGRSRSRPSGRRRSEVFPYARAGGAAAC